jgi:hypothetical protein
VSASLARAEQERTRSPSSSPSLALPSASTSAATLSLSPPAAAAAAAAGPHTTSSSTSRLQAPLSELETANRLLEQQLSSKEAHLKGMEAALGAMRDQVRALHAREKATAAAVSAAAQGTFPAVTQPTNAYIAAAHMQPLQPQQRGNPLQPQPSLSFWSSGGAPSAQAHQPAPSSSDPLSSVPLPELERNLDLMLSLGEASSLIDPMGMLREALYHPPSSRLPPAPTAAASSSSFSSMYNAAAASGSTSSVPFLTSAGMERGGVGGGPLSHVAPVAPAALSGSLVPPLDGPMMSFGTRSAVMEQVSH